MLFVLPVCWIEFLTSLWYAFQFNASYVYLVSNASFVYTDSGLSMNLYLQQRLLLYGIGLLGFFMLLKLMVLLQSVGSSAFRTVGTVIVAMLLAGGGLCALNSYARGNFTADTARGEESEVVTIFQKFTKSIGDMEEKAKIALQSAKKGAAGNRLQNRAAINYGFLEVCSHGRY